MSNGCVIYTRISLDVAGEGLGVERQERECQKLAESSGWEVVEVFSDNDISATSGRVRPRFEDLLQFEPSRIVVWHTDRLVRLTSDLERVIALDIPVNAVTSGHLDLSTPSGRAVARTVTAWATYEGEQKSLRQQAAHRQRVESGKPWWGHRRPFGYTVEGEVHPEEGSALRQCFEMIRQGGTYADAARYLNSEGLTTWGGQQWTGSRLSRVMRDPRNAGLIHYRKEIQGRGNWEAIVPEEEWRAIVGRAKAIAASRPPVAKGRKVRSLLGGIARCECGEGMKRTWQRGRLGDGTINKVHVYQCQAHCTSINQEWLDDYVTVRVLRRLASPARAFEDGPGVDIFEAKDAANEALSIQDRLNDLSLAFAEGEVTRDQLQKGSARLRERLKEASAKAEAFYREDALKRSYSASELLNAWKSEKLTLDQRREAVQQNVERLAIRKRIHQHEKPGDRMVILEMKDDPSPS